MKLLPLLILLIIIPYTTATTLHGSIYNSNLELEKDVLVEITTTPEQKYLSKDGTYSFDLNPGQYSLTANKGFNEITQIVKVEKEGVFLLDLFFLLDLSQEEDLWQDTQQDLFSETILEEQGYETWRYLVAAAIVIFAFYRFGKVRKKHGSLRKFKQKVKETKNIPENDESQLKEVLEVIRKHEGRIKQKVLRKELLHLSEAKVSLIVTELEHIGKVEKIKKGRGNILILK